jgi:hypothetical protein
MVSTQWCFVKYDNYYEVQFITNENNFLIAQLNGELTFNSMTLSISGTNGVTVSLDCSLTNAVIINSSGTQIVDTGISISSSAYEDIKTYIENKTPIDHTYSD